MKKSILFISLFILSYCSIAQIPTPVGFPDGVTVGSGTTNGMFTPPLKSTVQINALTGMQTGMIIYDTDDKCLKIFNGSSWSCLTNSVSGSSVFSENGPSQNFAKRISVGTGGVTANFSDMELANDSLYVVGQFIDANGGLSGTVTMDDFVYNYVFSTNRNHTFISKYSPQANRVWTFQFPTNNISVADIKWHNSFLYMTGSFSGSVSLTVNGVPTTYTASSSNDTFVAKMDGNGNILWFTQPTQSTGSDFGSCLAITKGTTDLYLAGSFTNTITLGGGAPLVSAGGTDVFITLLDTNTGAYKAYGGNYQNIRGGGTGSDSPTNLTSLVSLTSGGSAPWADLICTGTYTNSITFGTTTASSPINDLNTFIARFGQSSLSNPSMLLSIGGTSAGQSFTTSNQMVDNNFYFGGNKTLTTLQVATRYSISSGSLIIFGKTLSGVGTLLLNYDISLYTGQLVLKKVIDFKNLKVTSLKNGILTGHMNANTPLLYLDNKLLSDSQQKTIVMSLSGKSDLEWIRNGGHNNFAAYGTYASENPLAVKNHSGKVWVCERYVGNHSFGDWMHYGDSGKWFGNLWALY